jgi:hypothetical protein
MTAVQRRIRPRIGLTAVLVLVALLGACGDDDDVAQATTTTAPTGGDTTTTTLSEDTAPTTAVDGAPVAEGSGCAPGPGPLPDGRWYGLVDSASESEVSFDLACWYSASQAEIAAAEDGGEVTNDYYVRNEDDTLRTVAVADDTTVTWYPSGTPDDETEVAYDEWRTARESRGYQLAVWIDVEGGSIISIEEQWVP